MVRKLYRQSNDGFEEADVAELMLYMWSSL